jgi:hypothetical protein
MAGWRGVGAATNLGGPAINKNERMLMFVAKQHWKDNREETRI